MAAAAVMHTVLSAKYGPRWRRVRAKKIGDALRGRASEARKKALDVNRLKRTPPSPDYMKAVGGNNVRRPLTRPELEALLDEVTTR